MVGFGTEHSVYYFGTMGKHQKMSHFVWIFGFLWAILRGTGQTEPECRSFIGPAKFADLRTELESSLNGGLVILGSDQVVAEKGVLTTWLFSTVAENGTFWFDVWRPLKPQASSYKLVKSHEYNITTSGLQIVNLSYGQRFQVEVGDRFGMHFNDTNITVTQMITNDETPSCYAGNFDDVPDLSGVIKTSNLNSVQCAFAMRASVDSQKDPCGHMYLSQPKDMGIPAADMSSNAWAETLGVCSLKCLNEKSCMSFTFRRVINSDGYRVNMCDLNCAKVDDQVDDQTDTMPDDSNLTDYINFA